MQRCCLALIFLFTVVVSADAFSIAWDESVDGDLSNDHLNPTFVTLFPDNSKIIASTTFTPLDRDFLTITVPDGMVLDQIIWGLFDTTEDLSFFAVAEGNQITSIDDASVLLGTALISESHVTTNILDDLGNAELGGTGFTGPLGPGDYTFWFQENAADVNYGYTFVLAIPEPSLGIVPAVFGLCALSRRRR